MGVGCCRGRASRRSGNRARRTDADARPTRSRALSSSVMARMRGVSPMVRRPATMPMPASDPPTSPPAAAARRSRRRLLVCSPRPGRTTTEQAPQPALQHRPGHQPVLVGYGDDDRRSLPAVVAFQHPVREAPRALVPDECYAVGSRRPPGPLEQRRGTRRGLYAQGPCHAAYPFLEDLVGAPIASSLASVRRLGPSSSGGTSSRISSSSPRGGSPFPTNGKTDHLLCQEIAGCAAGSARLLSSAQSRGGLLSLYTPGCVLFPVAMVASAAYESRPFRLLRTS
jgi:hypothetical protein